MTAHFAPNQNPFDNLAKYLIKAENPIQVAQKVHNAPAQALNDDHLSNEKQARHKEAMRCAVGLVLYAIGLFLFAYGQMVQPSLLLMLAGSIVLILGCHTFMPEMDTKPSPKGSQNLNP